jgi:S1-C subfamily serine protease
LLSCSNSDSVTKGPPRTTTPSENYTTAFPTNDVSSDLQRANNSLLRIVSTSYYQNYYFDKPRITLTDILTNDLSTIADAQVSTENSSAGTSIVLQRNQDHSLLITCAHVVTSPDTTITYYQGDDILDKKYIKSISIKQKQDDIGFDKQKINQFNIIASNRFTDLALLKIKTDQTNFSKLPISFVMGNSDLLKAGSFLYILGFPKGYPMVTRGIVSQFDRPNRNLFVSDAIFNPGISGGLVLASKDNFNTMEWVGIARSATASQEQILVPRPDSSEADFTVKPYTDIPYVVPKKRISYGITQTIPISTIKSFLRKNEKEISNSGFRYFVDF